MNDEGSTIPLSALALGLFFGLTFLLVSLHIEEGFRSSQNLEERLTEGLSGSLLGWLLQSPGSPPEWASNGNLQVLGLKTLRSSLLDPIKVEALFSRRVPNGALSDAQIGRALGAGNLPFRIVATPTSPSGPPSLGELVPRTRVLLLAKEGSPSELERSTLKESGLPFVDSPREDPASDVFWANNTQSLVRLRLRLFGVQQAQNASTVSGLPATHSWDLQLRNSTPVATISKLEGGRWTYGRGEDSRLILGTLPPLPGKTRTLSLNLILTVHVDPSRWRLVTGQVFEERAQIEVCSSPCTWKNISLLPKTSKLTPLTIRFNHPSSKPLTLALRWNSSETRTLRVLPPSYKGEGLFLESFSLKERSGGLLLSGGRFRSGERLLVLGRNVDFNVLDQGRSSLDISEVVRRSVENGTGLVALPTPSPKDLGVLRACRGSSPQGPAFALVPDDPLLTFPHRIDLERYSMRCSWRPSSAWESIVVSNSSGFPLAFVRLGSKAMGTGTVAASNLLADNSTHKVLLLNLLSRAALSGLQGGVGSLTTPAGELPEARSYAWTETSPPILLEFRLKLGSRGAVGPQSP